MQPVAKNNAKIKMHVLFITTLFEIVGKGDKHIASEEIPRIFLILQCNRLHL